MKWKESLKPDLRKIVIFVVSFVALGYVVYLLPFTDVPFSFGFPPSFYQFGGRTMIGTYSAPQFFFDFFLIDVIISYLISCLILWIYDKVKKRR